MAAIYIYFHLTVKCKRALPFFEKLPRLPSENFNWRNCSRVSGSFINIDLLRLICTKRMEKQEIGINESMVKDIVRTGI